jgi:integrase
MKLTNANIKTIAVDRPKEVRDGVVADLALRINPTKSGKLTYTWKLIRKTETGKRVPETLGKWPLLSPEAARKRARAKLNGEIDGTEEQVYAKGENPTLREFMEETYRTHLARDLKDVEGQARVVLREFPVEVRVKDITPTMVLTWRAEIMARDVSNRTVNRYMGSLAGALRLATQLGIIPSNPASMAKGGTVSKLKEDGNGHSRFFTREEWADFDAALEDSPRWFADLCRVAIGTGARKGELVQVEWPAVDLVRNEITFLAGTTKDSETRTVPLTKRAAAVLEARGEKTGLVFADAKPTLVQYQFDLALKRAGIEKVNDQGKALSFRSLRTTYASWIVQKTKDIYSVSRLLGNSVEVAAQHYGHLANTLADAVSVLD